MPLGSRVLPCFVLSLMLSGCAANDLVVKRQAESEAKIEYLVQSSKKTEQRQNEFDGQIRAQDERFQLVNAELKRLKDENRDLRTSNDELKVRVAAVSKQFQTPKVEIVNQPSPVKASRESGPPAEYLKAFGLYSANNFPAAVDSFEAFLKNNPQSDYAANAQYWIGECHYTLSDLPKAKDAFSKVAEMYPKSSKTPDALLKLGFTLSAMKEKDKAAEVFGKIVTLYPSSPAAAKARERLSAH